MDLKLMARVLRYSRARIFAALTLANVRVKPSEEEGARGEEKTVEDGGHKEMLKEIGKRRW